MSLLDKIFSKPAQTKKVDGYFKTLNAYTPAFTTYNGGIYEMELTRSAIHSFATMCSKLKPEIKGGAYKNLEKILQFKPNQFMDTTKFIYRIATILSVDTTAFIIPLYENDLQTIKGYYPILPSRTELVQYNGEPWIRYTFNNGEKAAMELSKVGVLTQFQYKNDFFGDGNRALNPTLSLLDIQKQGMENGIKQSATLRFMAKLGQTLRPEDLKSERTKFSENNLSADNTSGLMMFDAKYSDVKQIDSTPFIIDADQMNLIQTNVYNYFGTNEDILQNKWTDSGFNAYYEGKIEPFALQLGLVMTNMTFNEHQRAFSNQIFFTSNRMQYASNENKLSASTQLFDRGILSINDVNDIWNLPAVEDGDKRYIRREYVEVDKLDADTEPYIGGNSIDEGSEKNASDEE